MLRYLRFGVVSLAIASLIVLTAISSTRVWYGQTKLVTSDRQSTQIGSALAVNEKTLVIGAANYGNDSGAAYVFKRSSSAPGWVEQAKLRPADVQRYDLFGAEVALSGDTLAIAAPGVKLPDSSQSNRTSRRGMVYVFTRNGSTWSEQARLVSPDAVVRRYGASITLEGDTLVVGDEGVAHVFVRDRKTNTWSHHARLTGPAVFGSAVALSGNTLVVGGTRASVFERDPTTGVWQAQAQLAKLGSEGFGQAVALKGDTLVVGAYDEPQRLYVRTGAAYVFQRDPLRRVWHEQAKLVPRGARVGGGLLHFINTYGFGYRVAIDQDAIVVSACAPGAIFYSQEQAAYLFRQDQRVGRWRQQAKLLPSVQSRQNFGCSIARWENTILVGATGEAAADGTRATGAVYLFDLRDAPP